MKKFEVIKEYLSFQDEVAVIEKKQTGYDPLFGIRKLLDSINSRLDSIPKTARLCVDNRCVAQK